ncbi:hypothetical protein, partial [Actinoplanes sp. NPDC026623]|uniref:hypothetical protein n=1 Tax=Actinoplanes sp. NPDC026623 TaxID=3155610 RepID=UPI0033EF84EF
MKFRSVARWCALGGLLTALAIAAPAESHRRLRLPACPTGAPSTTPPTVPPGPGGPAAVRAAGPPEVARAPRGQSAERVHR